MRKLNVMRAAVLLLGLTLITSSFVGGTFAKYVTSADNSGSDTARVAKWGITITPNEVGTFGKNYKNDVVVADTETGVEVASSTTAKVVAPGTEGDLLPHTISGKPEVAFKINYEADLVALNGWTITYKDDTNKDVTEYYCPMIITVDDEDYVGNSYENANAFAAAISAAIENVTREYEPNTELTATNVPEISWRWEFEGATDDEQTDEKDTALGDAAAKGDDTTNTVNLNVKVVITQLDGPADTSKNTVK